MGACNSRPDNRRTGASSSALSPPHTTVQLTPLQSNAGDHDPPSCKTRSPQEQELATGGSVGGDGQLYQLLMEACAKASSAEPIRIAIIGKRGVGKSTWVNSVRKLRPKQRGAATVGADEVTTDEQRSSGGARYAYHGLIFQDVPGAEGSEVDVMMGEDYIARFHLHSADACVLMYTSVLELRMLEFAETLETKYHVPAFLARNKVGLDCRCEVNDGNAATLREAFVNIRSRAYEQISYHAKFRHVASPERLFLIESTYADAVANENEPQEEFQREFHRLKEALQHNIRDEAKRAQVKAIFTEDAGRLAATRAAACRGRKPVLTLMAAASAAIPVPILSQGGVMGVSAYAARLFLKEFCLTAELAGIPELNALSRHLLARVAAMTGPAIAAEVAADFLILIPAVGFLANSAVSSAVAATTMYPFFEGIIAKLEKVSVEVYQMSLNREVQMGRLEELVKELFPEAPES